MHGFIYGVIYEINSYLQPIVRYTPTQVLLDIVTLSVACL